MTKVWFIADMNGNILGKLAHDEADDSTDAILNWADENLIAELDDDNHNKRLLTKKG